MNVAATGVTCLGIPTTRPCSNHQLNRAKTNRWRHLGPDEEKGLTTHTHIHTYTLGQEKQPNQNEDRDL